MKPHLYERNGVWYCEVRYPDGVWDIHASRSSTASGAYQTRQISLSDGFTVYIPARLPPLTPELQDAIDAHEREEQKYLKLPGRVRRGLR